MKFIKLQSIFITLVLIIIIIMLFQQTISTKNIFYRENSGLLRLDLITKIFNNSFCLKQFFSDFGLTLLLLIIIIKIISKCSAIFLTLRIFNTSSTKLVKITE